MKTIIFYTAPILFFLFMAACAKETANSSNIEIKTHNLEKHTGDCEDGNSGNCAKIKLQYIEVVYPSNPLVQDKINSQIKSEMLTPIGSEKSNDDFEIMMQNFLDQYVEFKAEIPDAYQQWELERMIKDKYYDENILCCEFSEYSYLGGAHPNSFLRFSNFDLNSGNKINLSDILIEGYSEELNTIAEPIFRREKELTSEEDLTEAGFWFDDNKFQINNNFAITGEGLIFYYNSYEITAYAFGPTKIIIPYKEIRKLLKPNIYLQKFIIE